MDWMLDCAAILRTALFLGGLVPHANHSARSASRLFAPEFRAMRSGRTSIYTATSCGRNHLCGCDSTVTGRAQRRYDHRPNQFAAPPIQSFARRTSSAKKRTRQRQGYRGDGYATGCFISKQPRTGGCCPRARGSNSPGMQLRTPAAIFSSPTLQAARFAR